MAAAQETFQAPPPGTYPIAIIAAEAGVSGKGNSQIVVTLEITDGKFKGEQILDWVGTDPAAKGSGIGRGKMRVLLKGSQFDGLADAGAEHEVPDAVVAQALVGRRLFVVIDNSPRKRKDENNNRTNENMTQLDPATNQLVTIMNADVKGYTLHATTTAQPGFNAQPALTQIAQQPGFATAPPQQIAQQVVQAQAGYAPQAQAGTATPSGLPFTPNFTPGTANPPWAAQNGAAAGATQEAAKKGGRKGVTIQDQQG